MLLFAGCTRHEPTALDAVRQRGELHVVTLNLPTCYYLGAQGTEGLEYQLARRFAAELGVKLAMYPVANERAVQAELAAGRVPAQRPAAARHAAAGVGAHRGARRQPAGAHPRAPEAHGGPEPRVGADRTELGRPGGRRRFRAGAVRDHRCARIFLRSSPLSERAGGLRASGGAAGAMDRAR